MRKHEVLVVDDSAVSRKVLTELVEQGKDLKVAFAASKASLAYNYLAKNQVSLVILDVNMPEIDGIEAAGHISKTWPGTPILMCSGVNEAAAKLSVKALEAGATDFIPKPTSKSGLDAFKASLHRKIAALVQGSQKRRPTKSDPTPINKPKGRYKVALGGPFATQLEAITIGCSTGGPVALSDFFGCLKAPFPVPTFIVQHMPPVFTRLLAERLAAKTGFTIKEGEHGEEAQPGVTYIAPGGKHMVVTRKKTGVFIELNEGPQEHSCRPAVDVLFRSIGDVYRDRAIAAVFTGMGADGSGGTAVLAKAGCEILVQDPSTCVVPSMPQASLQAGNVHQVLTLKEIAQRFEQRCSLLVTKTRKAL